MLLSVCIVTHNEEANIARTLESVKGIADEIVIVDSRSTDNTVAIARSFGAKVFVEDWKGFAVQKNSANAKASGNGFSRSMLMKRSIQSLRRASKQP